jgi:molybdate transport system substrate-binding protein
VVSYEANVSAVLQKVSSGEADAGIVYMADALASPAESIRVIMPETPVQAEYVASLLPNAQTGSQGFLDYIMSATAAPIWHAHGFTAVA